MLYSSVLEAHINVLQGLQKISAYTEDQFYPEEIDFHLTRQQERLLEEIVNKRFEDKQISLDYIRSLIVKNKKLQVFRPAITEAIYEPNMVYGVLPANYYHLVNDRSTVVSFTSGSLCNDLTSYKTNQSLTEYTATLAMPTPTNTTLPFYYNTKVLVTVNGSDVEYALPATLNPIKSANSWFVIVNYIRENLLIPNVNIYWESYRALTAPKSFIFTTTSNNISKITIQWETSSSNATLAGNASATFTGTAYNIPILNVVTPAPIALTTPNLLTESDEFYEQELNVFNKTKKNNPKTQLSNQYLMAYEDKSFLISDLLIDYIRKPKHISLALNQNFELTGDAPRIIVDRTIEYLKLAIENPAYQGVLNDNNLRNQI